MPQPDLIPAGGADFDFLFGKWTVRHERLRDRLVGDTRWQAFDGTCEVRPILGGLGNIDDNLIHLPDGAYRAATLRRFDPATGQWSIWWMDARSPGLEPPVHGRFEHGVGTFYGDDSFRDQAIRVRFLWSDITGASARWQQAFSLDDGATWETNWRMQFSR